MRTGARTRVPALCAALVVDVGIGDPQHRLHPTAVAGRTLARGLAPWPGRGRAVELLGGGIALAAVAAAAGGGAWTLERSLRLLPAGSLALGLALKPTFAFRQLLDDGRSVAVALDTGDVQAARTRVGMMVSRPTADLSAEQIAAAAIESVAENLADSIVAPLLAFALGGLPAAAVYRVVNTADAMVGYRDEREWLGKVAARTDDVLNLVPSRLSALLLAAAARPVEGSDAARAAVATAWRDHGLLASVNAGWTVGAMAGALGRSLDKPGHYVVGAGCPPPTAADIHRATRLSAAATVLLVAVLLGALAC